ncbi:MAG: hypothetical protein IPN90_13765 [Elusimicrobia bacterium]|nr:hypothetical protein [Elusimicrobiota bacterium]
MQRLSELYGLDVHIPFSRLCTASGVLTRTVDRSSHYSVPLARDPLLRTASYVLSMNGAKR